MCMIFCSIRYYCFNPCFGGSVSSTQRLLTQNVCARVFQSLFWWIGLFDGVLIHKLELIEHVSILVLVDRSLRPRHFSRHGMCTMSFNPCFGGSVSSTYTQIFHDILFGGFQSLFWWIGLFDCISCNQKGCRDQVSILVLVDRSLRQILISPLDKY